MIFKHSNIIFNDQNSYKLRIYKITQSSSNYSYTLNNISSCYYGWVLNLKNTAAAAFFQCSINTHLKLYLLLVNVLSSSGTNTTKVYVLIVGIMRNL